MSEAENICQCCRRADEFFFFKDTATTEIYTLPLHDALPIKRKTTPPTESSEWYHTGGQVNRHIPAANRCRAIRFPASTSLSVVPTTFLSSKAV